MRHMSWNRWPAQTTIRMKNLNIRDIHSAEAHRQSDTDLRTMTTKGEDRVLTFYGKVGEQIDP